MAMLPIFYDFIERTLAASNTVQGELVSSAGLPGGHWPGINDRIINPSRPWVVATD
ncbi:hypothetical protein [Actinoplanes aureus]|uniref:Uncharacterized protein n=1 Tax=Actinoplanes aureus TaxID=2792083 RepID=A0A931CFV2_9ACTN|nr:hypothetical protein [Actinoplanes aureus]MBG0567227.1 hypothetical protein [Actinoplanes aureus]